MPEQRKKWALALVGSLADLDQWFFDPARPPAADQSVHEALQSLGRRFNVENPHGRADTPLVARCRIGALIVWLDSGLAVGVIRILNEYLADLTPRRGAWTPTTLGCDYLGSGFTERAVRGLAAALIGGSARPDQVSIELLGFTEHALRKARDIAEDGVVIPPAGWDVETAAFMKKRLVDAQYRKARKKKP